MPTSKYNGTDFISAANYLGDKDSRPIANNTRLERFPAVGVGIVLHATAVLMFNNDGTITLNSNGYRTITTKERMNAFLPRPYKVQSVKGAWFITKGYQSDQRVPFYDGITFNPEKGLPASIDTTLRDSENAETYKAITRYMRGLTNEKVVELFNEATAKGAYGDCLWCQIDNPADTEHLRLHVEEGYYMASLIRNAVVAKGYQFPEVIMSSAPDLARRALRTYLRKALLVDVQVIV